MSNWPYPADTHLGQLQEVLRLLIHQGTLTHLECETLTKDRPWGQITTLRSAVSDLRADHHWPIQSVQEGHAHGTHARYLINWPCLAADSGIPMKDLKRAAEDWVNQWAKGKSYSKSIFLEFAKPYAPKNPAADGLARLIFKSKKMVRRDEAQGELWAY